MTIKSLLKRQIISTLYFEKPVSVVELSNTIGKSVPNVTKAVNELVEDGLIQETGFASSSGGRKPKVFTLKADTLYLVAVAMDQLYLKITITDLQKNPVLPVESYELKLLNNEAALTELVAIINTSIEKAGINRNKILGVGVGIPGFTNTKLGINYSYLRPPGDAPIAEYLQQILGIPVRIDNDASLIALAELKYGLAKGKVEVMVINLGWGIGLGMIINGILFRGFTGHAGELSHIPISESDTLCECGKRGCLETEATLRVITEKAMKEMREGKVLGLDIAPSLEEMSEVIMVAANKGNQYAIELLSDMGYKIGKAIAILIHIVNPELIVLSGRGAMVGKILLAPIQQALNKYCIPRLSEHTEVKISHLGRQAELKGAAALIMESLMNPVTQLERVRQEHE
jgi:predicted NBD/HSP70 family sugar kinase